MVRIPYPKPNSNATIKLETGRHILEKEPAHQQDSSETTDLHCPRVVHDKKSKLR